MPVSYGFIERVSEGLNDPARHEPLSFLPEEVDGPMVAFYHRACRAMVNYSTCGSYGRRDETMTADFDTALSLLVPAIYDDWLPRAINKKFIEYSLEDYGYRALYQAFQYAADMTKTNLAAYRRAKPAVPALESSLDRN